MLRSILRGLCVTVLTVFLMGIGVVAVSLPDGTVINNNTKCESVPSSYTGVDYYDVLIPYTMKISEIGGHSIGGRDGSRYVNKKMTNTLLDNKVGNHISRETDISSQRKTIGDGVVNISKDSGLNIATDEWGNKYYMLALGQYCYPGGTGQLSFTSSNRGQLVDVVFTNGKVVHFILTDAKASVHTNGGEGSSHNADESDDNKRRGWIDWYKFADLEKPEGQNMFQALNSEVLEIFASSSGVSKFQQITGMSDTSDVHIAFIRMYSQKYTTAGNLRDTNIGTDPYYDLGNVTFARGETSSTSMGSSSLSLTGGSLVDEWSLVGMPARNDMTVDQARIILMGRDGLTLNENELIAALGNNMVLMEQTRLLDVIRTVIIFAGLICLLYGLLIFAAMVFDKANTFIDFSMISLLTFGKMRYDPFDETLGKLPKGYVSTKKLAMMGVIVLIVGMTLVSGGTFRFIGNVLFKITEYFT